MNVTPGGWAAKPAGSNELVKPQPPSHRNGCNSSPAGRTHYRQKCSPLDGLSVCVCQCV
ncbi:Pathogenicity factor [Anopheles sinensis]|uniref:Pathogenicity factor n=1 Tax=Anopheles sinensis TaxID=74873 RepID=A0A084WKD7_ANOSI|nr:Pathogenicity factor [Anopheles sinensis]